MEMDFISLIMEMKLSLIKYLSKLIDVITIQIIARIKMIPIFFIKILILKFGNILNKLISKLLLENLFIKVLKFCVKFTHRLFKIFHNNFSFI